MEFFERELKGPNVLLDVPHPNFKKHIPAYVLWRVQINGLVL